MHHPISTHYDDHDGSAAGSAPIGDRLWDRVGIAASAWSCGCGRVDRVPNSHALHHASDLPLFRTSAPVGSIKERAIFLPHGSGVKKLTVVVRRLSSGDRAG